jgi:hypothetical protein
MDKEARIERAGNPLISQDVRAHEVAKTTEDVAARNIIHELLDEMDNMIVRIEELEDDLTEEQRALRRQMGESWE